MRIDIIGRWALFVVTFLVCPRLAAQQSVLRFDYDGLRLEGLPLTWDAAHVQFLGRDGYLRTLESARAQNVQKLDGHFQSYSQGELRSALVREFGGGFEVTGTGHFLVVQAHGKHRQWANRFEELYRSMMHYFSTRGITTHAPPFPLVAVVMPTQQHFIDYARQQGANVGTGHLGFYASDSNRILMYDFQAARTADDNWTMNAATIVHEAAHQTAFNTGIHSRYCPPPRWICEGLGTMFEAPGVHSSLVYANQSDRINRDLLRAYRRSFANGLNENHLVVLIATDDFFQRHAGPAYALSWALTFTLAEQQPVQLASYLQATSSHQAFTEVSAAQRVQDFATAFGRDLRMLAARVDRLMSEIK